jgi:hypothetical protein
MIREERAADWTSLEARKMRPNQSIIGSQYFANERSLDTANSKKGPRGGRNLKLISFAR